MNKEYNEIDNNTNKKRYINNQFLRNRNKEEKNIDMEKINNIEDKNNFIRKEINDNIFISENLNIKSRENNNNIKNNYNQNKIPENNNINNIDRNSQNQNIISRTRNNSYKKARNRINSTRPSLNKKSFNTFNYMGINTTPDKIPKLNYINIVNTHHNTENNYFQTFSNKNSQESYIMTIKEKRIEERQKNIKNAINELLDKSLPMNTLEKEKNIQLTIQSKKSERLNNSKYKNDLKKMLNMNINNDNNNDIKKMNSFSQNEINENFVVINNQKILKRKNENTTNKNNSINNEIRKNIGMDKNKKYPEPDDIDENLVSSNVEPIPDLEQHNKIQKIEMDYINNQFEENNNNNDLNIDNKKEINNRKISENYIKDKIINDNNNNLVKSFDEENE